MRTSSGRLVHAAVALLLALGTRAAAQTQNPRYDWEDSLPARDGSGERHVRVALPADYYEPQSKSERYPVLIMLDGEGPDFPLVVSAARRLAARGSLAIPQIIVVGVRDVGPRRGFDMYPPPTTADDTLNMGGNTAGAGGVNVFLDFLADELKPWIAQHFRAAPFYVISGHSASGFFVVYAAQKRPDVFQGVIANSPALWWNDAVAARTYAPRIARDAKHPRFFLGLGGYDATELAVPVRRFAAELRRLERDSSRFTFRLYPEDDHPTTEFHGTVDGLRFVFRPVSLTTSPLQPLLGFHADTAELLRAFEETRQRYAAGARLLGLRTTLPPQWVTSKALTISLRKRFGVVRAMCDVFAGDRPDLPTGNECARDARLALADTAGARRDYGRALTAARALGDSDAVEELQAQLMRLSKPR